MKTQNYPVQKRNGIPFLMLLLFVFVQTVLFAQTAAPTVFALTTLQQVSNSAEFEKLMKENWKPLHQLRKQNGKITNWALYRVHMTGASDEYNYVSVMYFDSFVKTEANDNYLELMKAANPKADAADIISKTSNVRTIMRQAIYSRVDGTTPKAGAAPAKYIEIDFMKVTSGMGAEYVRVEKEDWKPVHQALVDGGQRVGWTLWSLAMPAGTSNNHDYVTSNIFSGYDQFSNQDYEGAFKKAHPGKDANSMMEKTGKARNMVKSELWELVMTLN